MFLSKKGKLQKEIKNNLEKQFSLFLNKADINLDSPLAGMYVLNFFNTYEQAITQPNKVDYYEMKYPSLVGMETIFEIKEAVNTVRKKYLAWYQLFSPKASISTIKKIIHENFICSNNLIAIYGNVVRSRKIQG